VTPPPWLAGWAAGAIAEDAALARFDALAAVQTGALRGVWRGRGLATGHPLDGVLEALGWYGKAFENDESVHPLLFDTGPGDVVAAEPAWLPAGLPLRLPGLARSAVSRRAFRALLPALRARRPGACLRRLAFRGVESAAMVYRRQPIIDHFRAVDPDRVVGAMVRPGMTAPYFFLLERTDLPLFPPGGRIVLQDRA
jgi:hypothetical protein